MQPFELSRGGRCASLTPAKRCVLALDHRAKVIAAQGALLLEAGSNGCQVVDRQGFVQQLAVGLGAWLRRGSQVGVFAMRCEHGFLTKTAMAGVAGPGESCWIIGHAGAGGIEIYIAVAVQHIAFAVDQASLVAAFPQRSGAPVSRVELADAAPSEFLHETRACAELRWLGQQVNMSVHEHVGVQLAAAVEQRFAQ